MVEQPSLLRKVLILYPLAGAILMCGSCKKDDPVSVPQIIIYSPADNSEFNVLDTIRITGEIYDQTGIISVSFSLDDANFVNVLPGFSRQTDKLKKYSFNVLFPLDDIRIKSGYYYLKIVASNAEELKRKYVKIYLNQQARQKKGIVLTTNAQNYSSILFSENSTDFEKIYSLQGMIKNSICDSYNQQIYALVSNPDHILSYGITDSTLRWEEYPPGAYSKVTAFNYDELLYYGTEKGDIRGLSISGINKFSTEAKTDTIPENIIVAGDMLISDNRLKASPDNLIVVYYKTSGQEIKILNMNMDIQSFHKLSNNQVLFFANTVDYGISGYYVPEYNYFEEILRFSKTISRAEKADMGNYLLISDHSLYIYNSINHSLNEIFLEHNVTDLAFDEVSKEIVLITTDNRILNVQYPAGNIISVSEALTNELITDVNILYNF